MTIHCLLYDLDCATWASEFFSHFHYHSHVEFMPYFTWIDNLLSAIQIVCTWPLVPGYPMGCLNPWLGRSLVKVNLGGPLSVVPIRFPFEENSVVGTHYPWESLSLNVIWLNRFRLSGYMVWLKTCWLLQIRHWSVSLVTTFRHFTTVNYWWEETTEGIWVVLSSAQALRCTVMVFGS